MSSSIVAKRYAVALFQIAKENAILEQLENELRTVKEVVDHNPQFQALLKSPKLSIVKKQEIIKDAFATVSTYVLNTLMILVERHRDNYISEVADHFLSLANDERGVAEATVYSIRPLTETEQEALSAAFAAKVGKKSLKIDNKVNSDLLGGVKLRIGNRIFDGSLSGKLERLERKLLS